jgi:hypothetical protein
MTNRSLLKACTGSMIAVGSLCVLLTGCVGATAMGGMSAPTPTQPPYVETTDEKANPTQQSSPQGATGQDASKKKDKGKKEDDPK